MKEKLINKKIINIDNFIGVYDNYILPEECNKAIKLFEDQNKFDNTFNRMTFERSSILQKQDQQFFTNSSDIEVWWESLKPMMINFDLAWNHYIENVGAKEAYDGGPFYFTGLKIQKTLPTQGYHIWHVEYGKSFDQQSRAFVFSIYLNDVKEGGETEFLHFSKRVQPKTGRIVFWPAGFPYVHRGNSPLSGEKYLLTSWILLR